MPILRVAVPAPLFSAYDYLAPEGVDSETLKPGIRLRVPFGRGTRCGLLLGIEQHTTLARSRLKKIVEVLDSQPLLPAPDLALLSWAADYYQHPLGEVLFAALPAALRKGKPADSAKDPGWRITTTGAAQPADRLLRAPRQSVLLTALRETPEGLDRDGLYARCGRCREVLLALESKGWIERCTLNPATTIAERTEAPELTPGQRQAVAQMTRSLSGFQAFLLDGVTGSGKTEVYLALIERHLEAGHQVLVLVPEIALTPQLLRRFQRRIPTPVTLLHSGLAGGVRQQAWMDSRNGRARVLLGTRSSVFTPMPELGLIIVDEEHDLSYKQQEGFRYSARDMAVARAHRRDCPVVLGSATPSLETLHNADAGRYSRLLLPQRAGNALAPTLDLVDIRSVHLDAGLSPVLLRFMGEELEKGNQVLLFLNRRGYSPVLTCHDCGWLSECPSCDARMTFHKAEARLWCHHCGHRQNPPQRCPDCGHADLRLLGQGTERLEEVLENRFPEYRIARLDRDSTRRRGALQGLLEGIRSGHQRILLGTQMLAKGHHFPDVTLVGILDMDQGLFGADYRASERMAQMIVQVAGRAGRADKPGRVLIQTRHPDHPLLQTLIHQGYNAFARSALAERREAGFPPFSYQALMRAEAPTAATAVEFLGEALGLARPLCPPAVELWGPVPAPMEKRAGRFRAQLLIQAPQRRLLQRLLRRWIPNIGQLSGARRVRWSIDVDPQESL